MDFIFYARIFVNAVQSRASNYNWNYLIFLCAENVDRATICQLELDDHKVKQFKDAIENSYWFEFFMDTFCIFS